MGKKVVNREEDVQEHVNIKLTDAEILEKSKELAATLKEVDERNEQFKFVRAQHTGIIKGLKSHSNTLGKAISSGEETRYMKLIKKYDYENASITLIDPADWSVVLSRPMSDSEAQLNMVSYEPPTASELDENTDKKKKSSREKDIADVISLETHRKTKNNAIDT